MDRVALIAHKNDKARALQAGCPIATWLVHSGITWRVSGRVPRGQVWIEGPGYFRKHAMCFKRTPQNDQAEQK